MPIPPQPLIPYVGGVRSISQAVAQRRLANLADVTNYARDAQDATRDLVLPLQLYERLVTLINTVEQKIKKDCLSSQTSSLIFVRHTAQNSIPFLPFYKTICS